MKSAMVKTTKFMQGNKEAAGFFFLNAQTTPTDSG
jgi:hypothetical protein